MKVLLKMNDNCNWVEVNTIDQLFNELLQYGHIFETAPGKYKKI